jgi:ABC-type dipeptide/oligopeptide/nickel transport system permease subunit
MSDDPGTRELPGALADYAAGVADVVVRGGVVIAVPVLLLALLAGAVVGGGIALVVVAVVGPAVVVGLARELPSRVSDRFG